MPQVLLRRTSDASPRHDERPGVPPGTVNDGSFKWRGLGEGALKWAARRRHRKGYAAPSSRPPSHTRCFLASSPTSWWKGPPSISTIKRLRSPAQIRLFAADFDVQARQWPARIPKDFHSTYLGSAPCAFQRQPRVARHGIRQAARTPATMETAQVVTEAQEGQTLQTHHLPQRSRERPLAHRLRQIQKSSRGRRDWDPFERCRLALQQQAPINEQASMPAGPATSGPRDDLKVALQAPRRRKQQHR